MSVRRRALASALAVLVVSLPACTHTQLVTVLVPLAADGDPADDWIDVPFLDGCEAICLRELSLPSDQLVDCHAGPGPEGAAIWCTYEETVWERGP